MSRKSINPEIGDPNRVPRKIRRSINAETKLYDRNAAALRLTANTLSLGRVGAGATIAAGILLHSGDYRSLPLAITVGAVSATDMIDGNLARRAAKRLKDSTTRFGKWVDQSCDKLFTHALFLGVGLSEFVGGTGWEKAYGVSLLASDAYLAYRDKRMTGVRRELETQGKEIKARPWGKVKAALGMLTMTAAVSPLAEQAGWKEAVIAGAVGTVALAAYSLHDMENQLETEPAQAADLSFTGEAA